MLEISFLRNHTEQAKKRLSKRPGYDPGIIDELIAADDERRRLQADLDGVLAEQNSLSKEIGKLFSQGKKEEADALKTTVASLKERSGELQQQHDETADAIKNMLHLLPNLPQMKVPDGRTPDDNVTIRTGGNMPDLAETALPHWDLATKYQIIDFELGNKITGSGFPFYIGKGAKIQRALIAFFLDMAEKQGYTEYMPPLMVNEDSGHGTGQLPDKEGQMYHMTVDNFYMVPTAEVPLTNVYRDVILREDQLPIKMTAYTPCFRREAGSYGKDVRGLNRLHQFDKVEVVHIEHPDRSDETLQAMVNYVESLVQALKLPYRILHLCGGDTGFASACTYDFEVYAAAQKRWLEVSSVSNFESFQANRMKCRYKDAQTGKNILVHTLNGSALALPRILAAILENYQTTDGISVPEVLRPYCRFDVIN
jgi:seryl-tRNA synthetase